MTVGEKIQFYRKKIGLSQEELGQKLLVSRQTVSLWEMDKTLPTVDNLLRLKEIFTVSIDDILSESVPPESDEKAPKETYVFQYQHADLRQIFKKASLPLIRRAIIFTVIGTSLLIGSAASSDMLFGVMLGFLLIGIISHIKGYFSYKKAWMIEKDRFLKGIYSYEVFDEYFVLNISHNEEITKTQKVYFGDIEKIQVFGNLLVFQSFGQSYILKKDILNSNSVLIDFYNKTPDKVVAKKPKDALKIISILLFVLSILTIWGALISEVILSGINQTVGTENMWVFFLFTPIPIASIVFGFYLKKKGCKYKKNVIVGFIMTPLLCIYGSFTFIFANVYSHDDKPILEVEALLEIDIPTHSRINTQDWTQGTQSVSRGYIYSTSDIYFDEHAVEEFENHLPDDEKWISEVPSDLVGITSFFCDSQGSDYYMIYNIDTNEFNALPNENGTYRFINLLYHAETNTMKLVKYEIEYIK